MQNHTIDQQIAAYLSGNLTAKDREDLLVWVDDNEANRAYFDQAVALWALAQEHEPTVAVDTSAAWQRLNDRLFVAPAAATPANNVVPLQRTRRIPDRWFGIAASIVLLLSVGYWWLYADRTVTVQTVASERYHLTLPDGSQVWLNENSLLTYSSRFRERQLTLSGEAFFDVVRDTERPFAIETEQATTRVLGTSFNVRAYPADAEVRVSVTSGSVALQDTDEPADQIQLTPGETGVFIKATATVKTAPETTANVAAWKSRRLAFANTPLREVVPTLERYFGKKIELADPTIAVCTIVGEYDDPTLAEVLAAMAFSLDLEVDSSRTDVVRLSGEGCE